MFAVATVLGVAALASGAQAALVLWREGSEPTARARLAAKVTAACCVAAGALSLGCYRGGVAGVREDGDERVGGGGPGGGGGSRVPADERRA